MARPLPHPDPLTEPYWAATARGELAFPRCHACNRHHFYPKPVCPHCGATEFSWEPVSGRGSIYSYSVVHRAPGPAFADDVPYVIAIIKTDEGPHLMSRVDVSPESVSMNMRVKARFLDLPENMQLPVFAPEEEHL